MVVGELVAGVVSGALVGYARISTREQEESLASQREWLLGLGCERVFEDVISGAFSERPGLKSALEWIRPDGCLVVTRLDRLGRSTVDTLKTVAWLEERGVSLRVEEQALDTRTASGGLVLRTLVSLAEWERDLLVDRTKEGLAHARAQGRVGGRPRKLSPSAVRAVRAALEAGLPVKEVARLHGVSRRTIARVRSAVY